MLVTSTESVATIESKADHKLYVLANSKLMLLDEIEGNAVFSLLAGAVRIRSLSANNPQFTVFVKDRLQLDVDALGDTIVQVRQNDPTTVTISAIQGTTRIIELVEEENKKLPTQAFIRHLQPGTCVNITNQSTIFGESPCEPLDLASIIRQTTPELMLSSSEMNRESSSQDSDNRTSTGSKGAIDQLDRLIRDGKHYAALTEIPRFDSDVQKSAKIALLAADASRRFYLHEQFNGLLQSVLKSNKKTGESHFLLGLIALRSKQFKVASSHFEKSMKNSEKFSADCNYYLGVHSYYENKLISATRRFTYALWSSKDPRVLASTRTFLKNTAEKSRFQLDVDVQSFYQSNILHLSDKDQQNNFLDKHDGYGLKLSEDLQAFVGRGKDYIASIYLNGKQKNLHGAIASTLQSLTTYFWDSRLSKPQSTLLEK